MLSTSTADAVVDQAVRANVHYSVEQLLHGSEVLEDLIVRVDESALAASAEPK